MLDNKYSIDYIRKSSDYLLNKISFSPEIAIVLGSCLGNIADEIEDKLEIDYKDIPNFLVSTVKSHAGKLIFGKLAGKNVVCLSGRFHFYEGYDFEQLVIPVRVLNLLGVKKLVLTNAAGGVNPDFRTGDIMLILDHIKLFGASPMRGPNAEEFGPRFFDVSNMYTKELQEVAREAAKTTGVDLKEGVYFFFPGPQFETPAEIRAARILGGDAVGMSTVTEALTAAHCEMQVLALSLISNMAAGVIGPVNEDEVDQTAKESAPRFKKLMKAIVERL